MFNIICDSHNYGKECQSESLETISDKVQQRSNVHIDIKIPWLHLMTNISFVNLESVAITGEPGLTTISCTTEHNSNAGIVFSSIIDKITLNNLKFTLYETVDHKLGMSLRKVFTVQQ